MMWLYHYSWWWTLDLFCFWNQSYEHCFYRPYCTRGNWFPRQLNQFRLPGCYVRLLVAPHMYQHLVLCTVRVLIFSQPGGCGFICISLMSVEREHFLCVYWPFGFPFWLSESLAFATCMSGYSLSLRFFLGNSLVSCHLWWFLHDFKKVSIIFSCFQPEVRTKKTLVCYYWNL